MCLIFGKKKNKGIEVGSPVKGKAVAISQCKRSDFRRGDLGKRRCNHACGR